MNKRVARLQRFLYDMGTKTGLARVASCLLFLRDESGARRSGDSFQLPILRREMSELAGVSPETLSRLLGRLVRAGVLRVQGRWVTILDIHRLESIAGD